MFEHEPRDGVTVLRLAYGKASALDLEFLERFADEVGQLARADVRAVVLTGTGRIFSAGVDLVRLRDGGADYARAFLPALDRAFLGLFKLEKPTVAAINGHAIAGGCVLAAACDVRLMAEGKGRIGTPELQVGVPFPAAAVEIMRAAIPPTRIADALLRGVTWTPQEAAEVGLVHEVVPAEDLVDRAVARAAELARPPALSFALTKRAIREPTMRYLTGGATTPLADEVIDAWASDEVRAAIDRYVRTTLSK